MSPLQPDGTHRRRNALTGEWVLVAAGRDQRPWSGQTERPPTQLAPEHDPGCYLCPGVSRVTGERNPDYTTTFVFDNDFAALRPDDTAPRTQHDGTQHDDPLFAHRSQRGTCRVICFSPRHDRTLATMTDAERRQVVELWCDQHAELSEEWAWVQIFENRGSAMGASNPHPHGQIWASSELPSLITMEDEHQRRHHETTGTALLTDYCAREVDEGDRVVVADEHWLAVVPYWATWPFETLLVSLTGATTFEELSHTQRTALATTLGRLLGGYDALFDQPFPYSMGWHPAPRGSSASHWVLHAHLYPPLLRADARKFLVGYELLAEAQRDITSEDAAQRLRDAVESASGRS